MSKSSVPGPKMAEIKTSISKLRYQQAMDCVEQDIRAGKYRPGQKLPAIRDLSEELGVSFLTMRRAMLELKRKGLLDIRHGAGTFVADHVSPLRARTQRVGLACRAYLLDLDAHHATLGAYLSGMHRRSQQSGCIVQPVFFRKHRFVENVGQTILDEQLGGVVVVGGGMRQEDYQYLRRHDVCVVEVSFVPRDRDDVITIVVDRVATLARSIEHLRSLGHKRIGFVTYSQSSDGDALHRGFAKLAFDHRLGNPRELMVIVDNSGMEPQFADVEQFFEIIPTPTGVIVTDEGLADVLLDACQRRGIRVPDDLSLVALQDSRPSGHRIPLTAAATARELTELAYQACDILIRSINGESIARRNIRVEPKLSIKASSGPAPSLGWRQPGAVSRTV